MGQKAREMIVNKFSLEKMVHEYESLYEEALQQKGKRLGFLAAGRSNSGTPSVSTTAEVACKVREDSSD
jgi:hypothetical protein